MGTDRSRRTYDASKQYRRVVPQQGRVVLEADSNESAEILSEATRTEVLDTVGPFGVPSDPLTGQNGQGYAIGAPVPSTRDFSIGAGTLYVGGLRVEQTEPALTYLQQGDWIDGPDAPASGATHEAVYLHLQEQEVTAVEDSTLREVALGGPDSAARTRLVRRVGRRATQGTTCSAFAEVVAAWKALGLVFDEATMSLAPGARLQVGIETSSTPKGACDPVASDGYLGAENQLICVQIADSEHLLWSYDNGSALYRVDLEPTEAAAAKKTLTLRSVPVDAFHQPKLGQVVEVLRAAVDLDDGNFMADSRGFVSTLAMPYDADSGKITLADALPAEFADSAKTRAVFVRVWESRLAFQSGTPVPLADFSGNHVGLQITLSAGPFVPGTFWSFAVRPTTPQNVYPARYLEAPQPAEGPRQWACPLGVIDWTKNPPAVSDCRPQFDDLVTLTALVKKRQGACCTVTVTPDDITDTNTLQTIIDAAKDRAGNHRVTICMMPGTYHLPAPLVLGPNHEYITLEGCHDGVVLQAKAGAESLFLQGLVVMNHADNVTFRRLRFHLPTVDFSLNKGKLAGHTLQQLARLKTANLDTLQVSIGLRPVHCANLAVKDCLFRFSIAEKKDLFGAGIFAGSECWGLNLENNRFLHQEDYLRVASDPPRMLFGLLLTPSVTFELRDTVVTGGTVYRTVLNEAVIRENLFSGLSAAALVYADLGSIRLEENRVRECYAGFWFVSLRTPLFDPKLARELLQKFPPSAFATDHPLVVVGAAIARAYPLPSGVPARHERKVALAPPAPASNLHQALAIIEQEQFRAVEHVQKKFPVLPSSIHLGDNDVEAFVAAGMSATSLVFWGTDFDEKATVLLSTNRMCNRGGGPTAQLIYAKRAAFTGNVILNEGTASGVFAQSLTLFTGATTAEPEGAGVAITGNVFRGPTVLPPRPSTLPAELRNWDVLNTRIP